MLKAVEGLFIKLFIHYKAYLYRPLDYRVALYTTHTHTDTHTYMDIHTHIYVYIYMYTNWAASIHSQPTLTLTISTQVTGGTYSHQFIKLGGKLKSNDFEKPFNLKVQF